jgi:hypothetical protein
MANLPIAVRKRIESLPPPLPAPSPALGTRPPNELAKLPFFTDGQPAMGDAGGQVHRRPLPPSTATDQYGLGTCAATGQWD